MNRRTMALLSLVLCGTRLLDSTAAEPRTPNADATVLWYKQPAETWSEAVPLGNGRLGAMVFGGPAKERILLNEETVWTGGPYQPASVQGAKHLPEIRRLVFQGDYARAHKLFGRHMLGRPVEQMKYQPLGNLWLTFPEHEQVSDYRRDLNLDTAVATVRYSIGDVRFVREALVSPVDQVVVVRLSASRPGQISLSAQLTGYRNEAHSNYGSEFYRIDGVQPDTLQLHGRTSTYLGVEGRVRFFSRAKFIVDGGSMGVDDDSLTITGADTVTILTAAATNFVSYKDLSGDAKTRVTDVLAKAGGKSYERLEADHVAAHRRLFRRVEIDLGSDPPDSKTASRLPTDQRCKRFVAGASDPQLAALYFQFGRYLLISSSRPGTKPANLQGIWNEEMNPKWDSKYTANINLQMNYWPAEVANLAECAEPLVDMLSEITEPGSYTARHSYGARGWVLHQNTDIWWATAPMDGPSWGTFSTGGAWLCTHLWQHYLYRPDREYLEKIYPVLRGAALFFVDTLVEHPTEKALVTCPATSPENTPHRPGTKPIHDEIIGWEIVPNICAGPTMDMQILRDLFSYVVAASEILDTDEALRKQLVAMRSRLAPMRIGRHGQLQEWLEDWDGTEDDHRHFSHLYGMYPSCQIDVDTTPQLARAVRRSVTMRGDYGTGFSMAWKMNLWARFRDGDYAHRVFRNLIEKQTCPNLFSICLTTPQVDGALGACAGIAEMLLQSHGDQIHLLPALPGAWPEGKVRGLRARGGFEVDLRWKDSRLLRATIRPEFDGPCKVRYGEKIVELKLRAGEPYVWNGQ